MDDQIGRCASYRKNLSIYLINDSREQRLLCFYLFSGVPELIMEKLPTSNVNSRKMDTKDDFRTILNDLRIKEGDDLVKEFITIFSTRIPNDIEEIKKARNAQDFEQIKQKTHFLSTSLLTLKFHFGFSLAEQIEKTIDEKNTTQTLKGTDEFIEYLNDALNAIS